LRKRVDGYFKDTGLDRRDQFSMYLKTVVIYAWLAGSYALMVFAPVPIWARVLAAVSIGFAAAGIGFSVMHDAGHRAYSKNKTLNSLLFLSLDLLGGSSYIWNVKHNIMHHSFANLDGHDDDIDVGALGRMSPEQPRLPFHRFQHLYIWPLYGFLVFKWHFWDDFYCWASGKVGNREMVRPRGMDAARLIGGKLVWFTIAFVIPSLLFPIWGVIAFYLLVSFIQGMVMAVVFQLAHCVEEAQFPPVPEDLQMEADWATHQLMTTVDFGRENRLLSWYIGGLNFQIEHHLFPGISHVHYPAISKIVEETCAEFGVPYAAQPTFLGGIRSHFRHLKKLGRPVESDLDAGVAAT
jgi:linoleoyl-CoA desaturase